jgi:hypothetical protein
MNLLLQGVQAKYSIKRLIINKKEIVVVLVNAGSE